MNKTKSKVVQSMTEHELARKHIICAGGQFRANRFQIVSELIASYVLYRENTHDCLNLGQNKEEERERGGESERGQGYHTYKKSTHRGTAVPCKV